MTIKLVAVTACVSGVAHTYMVAERLDKLCLQLKWQLKVETQGALGVEYSLTEDDILQADAVILINDVAIKEQERFQNCRCVQADIQTFYVILRKSSRQPKVISSPKPSALSLNNISFHHITAILLAIF